MNRPMTPREVAELRARYPYPEWSDSDRRIAAATELYTDDELLRLFPKAPEPEPIVEPPPAPPPRAPEPAPPTRHQIYIIRCGGFVKIGISSDTQRRARGMQGGNPFDLELVASFPGSFELERALHSRFAEYRHRLEWFREAGELATWIEAGCPL